MSGKRLYTDGKKQFVITDIEAAEMNRNRPAYLPPIAPVDDNAKIRSVYKNADGEIVDELLPAENVRKRAALGENVVADEDTIEAARVAREHRERLAIADEEDLTTLLNAAVPGAQFLQNLAVGEDAANQARQDLNTNMAASLVGNLAELALGGKALQLGGKVLLGANRAAKVGTALGFGKESSRLARVGRVAAADAAVESHFYVQNQLDKGGEFVAEEWGRQVGLGMIFGSPFILGAAARGLGGAVRQAVGQSNALGMVKTALTTGAVLAPPGSLQAATRARAAAATGLINKVFRQSKRRRALGVTDEAAGHQAQLLDDIDHVAKMDPRKLDNMAEGARAKWVDQFATIADEPVDFLRADRWGTNVKRINTMGRQVEGVRRSVRDVFKQLEGAGGTVRISDNARQQVLAEANRALNYTNATGMADVAGTIRRKVLAGDASPQALRKSLVEAAFTSKLKRGVVGGADQVDDLLSDVLRDSSIWGTRQATKNAKVVDSLDSLRQVWDDLGEMHITKNLRDLEVLDAMNLQKGQGSIEQLRQAVSNLADEGMLSEKQVRNFEARYIEADDAILKGTESYADVIQFNKALNSTQSKLSKQAALAFDIPTTPESFAATKAEAVMETAKEISQFASKGLDMVLSTKPMAVGATGVAALHGLSEQEKYTLYEELERELNDMVGNPMYFIDQLGSALDRGAAWDPTGADQAGAKTTNTIFYLQSQMPKRDMTIFGRQVPQPLSAVEEFLEKWAAAYDPVSVAYESLRGTVTPAMIDSVRATSPRTYSELQLTIAEILSKVPAEKANPSALVGASLFLGHLDPMYTGDFIAAMQSSYAQTATQDEVINGPRRPAGNIRNPGAEQGLTTSQRQQTY